MSGVGQKGGLAVLSALCCRLVRKIRAKQCLYSIYTMFMTGSKSPFTSSAFSKGDIRDILTSDCFCHKVINKLLFLFTQHEKCCYTE